MNILIVDNFSAFYVKHSVLDGRNEDETKEGMEEWGKK